MTYYEWRTYLKIQRGLYRLKFWMFKRKLKDDILGKHRTKVIEPLTEWLFVSEPDGTQLRYRHVRLGSGREKLPLKNIGEGIQLVDEEAYPVYAKTIEEIIVFRTRIKTFSERVDHRRMQKAAFGVK